MRSVVAAGLQREKCLRVAGSVMLAVILFQSVLDRLRRIDGTTSEIVSIGAEGIEGGGLGRDLWET